MKIVIYIYIKHVQSKTMVNILCEALEYAENFVIVSYILGMLAHLLSDMLKCTVVNCLKSYLFSLFPGPVLKKHQITCQMFLRTIKGIYNCV